jgi:hypothetical protein
MKLLKHFFETRVYLYHPKRPPTYSQRGQIPPPPLVAPPRSSIYKHYTITGLKSRLSIAHKVLEESLVPRTRLWRRLKRVTLSAERIVPVRARIARTIRLATRLDPHKRINKRVTGCTSGTHTEARALDVAPVTPFLAEASDTVARSVNDGLGGHAGGLELGGDHGNVELLVLRLVVLCVGGFAELAGRQVVRVPASDVGRKTADLLGAASVLVNGGELLSTGLCWERVSREGGMGRQGTYSGCRSSRASLRDRHQCTWQCWGG